MNKFQEKQKNKRNSIEKLGVEEILDRMEFARQIRDEIRERFRSVKEKD